MGCEGVQVGGKKILRALCGEQLWETAMNGAVFGIGIGICGLLVFSEAAIILPEINRQKSAFAKLSSLCCLDKESNASTL